MSVSSTTEVAPAAPAQWIKNLRVIDVDSHVAELGDLWTSRLPAKWQDQAPRLEPHPATGYRTWLVGNAWTGEEARQAVAGWHEWEPAHPHHLDEEGVDPGSWNATERLKRMDEYGIYAQVLYPNIIAFNGSAFMALEPELSIACVRAWNDFLIEFSSADPDRFIPIAMLPFWDVEACVAEAERAREIGHRGVLFGNKYEQIGLPSAWETHWDPVYAAVQDLEMPVNFHVAVGDRPVQAGDETIADMEEVLDEDYEPADRMKNTVLRFMLGNAEPITSIVTSGICDRFPRVKFVSVESGFGYIPYLLEGLDWHFKGLNGFARTGRKLPSEYFRRQCYGSFWFETGTLVMLDQYPDNFMVETDYPHPTGMCPGPCSPALRLDEHIEKHLSGLPEDVLRKVAHDNAAALYKVN